MPVDLTVAQLAAAMRVGDSAEETAEVTRLLGYASLTVEHYAESAPTIALNEAAIRISSYIYSQPDTSSRASFANSFRNSGAARMLLSYRIHKVGSVAGSVAETVAETVELGHLKSGGTDSVVLTLATSQSGNSIGVGFTDAARFGSAVPEPVASLVYLFVNSSAFAVHIDPDAAPWNTAVAGLDVTISEVGGDGTEYIAELRVIQNLSSGLRAVATSVGSLPAGFAALWTVGRRVNLKIRITSPAESDYAIISEWSK